MAIAGVLEVQMVAEMARFRRDMGDVRNITGRTARSIETFAADAKRLLGGIGLGLGLRELAQYSDMWTSLQGRLKLVTESTEQLIRVQGQLFDMAQRTRSSFEATADLYTRIARATQDLNTTDAARLRVTEAINKSLVISGAASESARAALVQLGQGFAAGTLRGEELNSVLEQAPRLAEAIAAGMGVSIGQLRALGKEGKLTAESVFNAISSQAEVMEREFSAMPKTIAQAFTGLNNELLKFVGQASTTSSAGQGLAEIIDSLAKNVHLLEIPLQAVIILGGNIAFVFKGIYNEAATLSAQITLIAGAMAKFATGNFKAAMAEARLAMEIGAQARKDAAQARKEFDEWEKRILSGRTGDPGAHPGSRPRNIGGLPVDEAALKKHLAMLERYRKMDADSWVKAIDAMTAEWEEELREQAKLTEEFYKQKEKIDKADMKAVFDIIDAEQEYYIAMGAVLSSEMTENNKKLEELAKKTKAEAERAAEDAKRAQVDMWREVDRVAHDTFVSIFDSGKSAFDRLRDALKNGLFSLLYQMTIRPIVVQVVGSVAGPGIAQAAFPGAGGGIGNLLSTGSSISNLFTGGGLGASIFGSAGAYAAAVPGLTSAAVGSQAALLAAQTGVFGAAGLGSTAAAGGASALGAGISTLGSALPYVGAALAIGSALGIFGGKKSPAVGTGYTFMGDYTVGQGVGGLAVNQNFIAGSRTGFDVGATGVHRDQFNADIGRAVDEFAGVAKQLFGVGSLAGLTAKFNLTTPGIGQAQDDAAHRAIPVMVVNELAKQIIPELDKFSKEGEEAVETFVRLGSVLKLTDEIAELVGADVEEAFGGVGVASLKLRDELVNLMGGLDQAAALTSSYFQEFYTEAERLEIQTARINRALVELGVDSLPQTRAQFRALVEAQDLSTEAGREMFASLMQLAPAFAAVTQTMEEAAAAASVLAGQIATTQSNALRAINDQIHASRAAANAALSDAETYRGLAQSIAEAIQRIRGTVGSGANLNTVFQSALTGDAAALAKLPSVAEEFLAGARSRAGSATDFAREQARVVNMLSQAGLTSQAMVDWNEYQAELLETQTTVLESIRDQLDLPDPDIEFLQKQTELLASIAALVQGQTAQIVSGFGAQAVLVHDQTGKIVAGNSISASQLAALVTSGGALEAIRALGASQLQTLLGSAASVAAIRALDDAQLQAIVGTSTVLAAIRGLSDAQLQRLVGSHASLTDIRALNDQQLAAVLGSSTTLSAIRSMTDAELKAVLGSAGSLAAINTLSDAQLKAVLSSSSVLASIRALNSEQLSQLLGSTLTQEQIAELTGEQVDQIATGNSVQDVIRNLSAKNTSFSEEMLKALVAGDSQQTSGISQTVSLLHQLVGLTAQQIAEESARIKAAEEAAAAEAARVAAAAAAAKAAAEAAAAKAAQEAAMMQKLESVFQEARGTQTQAALAEVLLRDFDVRVWLSKQGIAGWNPVTNSFSAGSGSVMTLDQVFAFIKSATGHANGGIASGWSIVGERGPELANFTSPARIYTAEQTSAALSGGWGTREMATELHALRAELAGLREEVAAMRKEAVSGSLKQTQYLRNLDRNIDSVTEGGFAMRTEAVE